jgi:hypothetical protein
MLLHGVCAPAAAPTRIVDHLGADPIGVFAARAAELAVAFAEQGALDRVGHQPDCDRTGVDLVGMRVGPDVFDRAATAAGLDGLTPA